jgi:hypothetical protein
VNNYAVKFITNAGAHITIERQSEEDARTIYNVVAESPNVNWVARYGPPPMLQARGQLGTPET